MPKEPTVKETYQRVTGRDDYDTLPDAVKQRMQFLPPDAGISDIDFAFEESQWSITIPTQVEQRLVTVIADGLWSQCVSGEIGDNECTLLDSSKRFITLNMRADLLTVARAIVKEFSLDDG